MIIIIFGSFLYIIGLKHFNGFMQICINLRAPFKVYLQDDARKAFPQFTVEGLINLSCKLLLSVLGCRQWLLRGIGAVPVSSRTPPFAR